MSYLWKKLSGIEVRMCGDASEGVEKMESVHKSFNDQIGKQPYTSGAMSLIMKHKKKQKRFRSAFTTTQIALLEQEFKKGPYVTTARRELVARALDLPERAVKIWFQNRRMKEKRDTTKGDADETEDMKDKSPINDIKKLRANKQTNHASLADKIVFSDDETIRTDKHNQCTDSYNEMKTNQRESPLRLVKSEKELIITKIVPSASLVGRPDIKIEFSHKAHESTKNIAKSSSQHNKQPVGHILPFSQVSESQKSPQNLSKGHDQRSQENLQQTNVSTDLLSSYQPVAPTNIGVDLTKYYPTMPPVQHVPWNRMNIVPIVPTGPTGMPMFPSPQGALGVPNVGPTKKCSCDCHVAPSFDPTFRYQQPMFYTQYVPQFITHTQLPTQTPTSKF
ncbi:hypothetical protein JYU34_004527 [Plutella xylostella]|uniref:Homeobox domain-containing protein n=1 Tax=Plutella xylostella TaxID=51655 RepID=A0ABQ7QY99_PLUXY|nr:hypothetical protein JYU34_004527 [Plutella xylostella]